MMTGKPKVMGWLAHRAGAKRLEAPVVKYVRKALELNSEGESFIDTFGKKEIETFIGFVDLVGFSNRVKGFQGAEIGAYLRPFLTGTANLVRMHFGLVDKTIGDEIMFILPDMSEGTGFPAVLPMGQLLGGLHDLKCELGHDYEIRFGLAYGTAYVDCYETEGYHEWTVVGEVVNLAKRMSQYDQIDSSKGIGGAFGMLREFPEGQKKVRLILEYIAGCGSRMCYTIVQEPVTLKGVSPAFCALLVPKTAVPQCGS